MRINPKHPSYVAIREYQTFKNFVASVAEINTDLVDVCLMRSFVDELDIHVNIKGRLLETDIDSEKPNQQSQLLNSQQLRADNFELMDYMDEVFKQGINELVLCRPNKIMEALKTPAMAMEDMSTKMDLIMQRLQ